MGEHIFALLLRSAGWANTHGATYSCSTGGAPLLDATQWHLGTLVKWCRRRHDARTALRRRCESTPLKGKVQGKP